MSRIYFTLVIREDEPDGWNPITGNIDDHERVMYQITLQSVKFDVNNRMVSITRMLQW